MQIYQENFNNSNDQIEQRQFQSFVQDLDLKMETALKKSCRTSLIRLNKAICVDTSEQSHTPIFRVYTKLFEQHKKVDFTPSRTELKDMIDTVIDKMQQLTKNIPRLEQAYEEEKAKMLLEAEQKDTSTGGFLKFGTRGPSLVMSRPSKDVIEEIP